VRGNRVIILLVLSVILIHSCKDIYDLEKYQQPDWLTGKLFTQISQQERLSVFSKCLELTGYDSLLDRSGSYTVFAPTDEAFNQYFLDHPEYSDDVSNIPQEELFRLVRSHIIQDAWSRSQFRMLDVQGWIDPKDERSKPRAYKRQTLHRDPNTKYWINYEDEQYSIVDSTVAESYRMVVTDSRKYVPIFFQEFFDIYQLSPTDYEFYFDRSFESGSMYYAGAKMGEEEIFAENGFIYSIDRVVTSLLNAEELLSKDYTGDESYKIFFEMIYEHFPQFNFNLKETNNQAEAREGKKFDSLYNLFFPGLPFNISGELTGNYPSETYDHHNAAYVPVDAAFQRFIDEVVTVNSGYPHWRNWKDVPEEIKRIIVTTHFNDEPVYETDIYNGFQNDEGVVIQIDPSSIIRKEYGSNCTFLGLSETIMPRAFASVTGPVYLRPGYSTFMRAIQKSNVLPALTRQDGEYSFFILDDATLYEDSSLLINWTDVERNEFSMSAFDRGEDRIGYQSPSRLAKRFLNQIGKSVPNGSADKEFIETLGGNFIVWNNVDQTVQGGIPNVHGYRGDSVVIARPVRLEEPSDNGITYTVNSWFNPPGTQIYGGLARYDTLLNLLQKAGLFNPNTYEFEMLTRNEYYTIFVPPDKALIDYGADTLCKEDLANFLKYHFIKGERIFTDGRKEWKNYGTLRVDELSSEYSKTYSTLNIRPSADMIEILDSKGNTMVVIHEEEGTTNIMISYDSDPDSDDVEDLVTTVIIHEIDRVLVKQ